MKPLIYLIGSLKNPEIPKIANELRTEGWEVFDDWFTPGPDADDHWRDYEKARGHNLKQALEGRAAKHIFAFDFKYLDRARYVVLVAPAGKSGHMELGWAIARGKKAFYLLSGDPDRFDVMLQLVTEYGGALVYSVDELLGKLEQANRE